jgi:hypothetical protein
MLASITRAVISKLGISQPSYLEAVLVKVRSEGRIGARRPLRAVRGVALEVQPSLGDKLECGRIKRGESEEGEDANRAKPGS